MAFKHLGFIHSEGNLLEIICLKVNKYSLCPTWRNILAGSRVVHQHIRVKCCIESFICTVTQYKQNRENKGKAS